MTPAATAANLTIPVLPASTAVAELRSDKDRSFSSVESADLDELVRENNASAFDRYRALSGGEGNLFYSALQHLPSPRHDLRLSQG